MRVFDQKAEHASLPRRSSLIEERTISSQTKANPAASVDPPISRADASDAVAARVTSAATAAMSQLELPHALDDWHDEILADAIFRATRLLLRQPETPQHVVVRAALDAAKDARKKELRARGATLHNSGETTWGPRVVREPHETDLVSDGEPEPPASIEDQESLDRIPKAMACLDPVSRHLVKLVYLQGVPIKTAASRSGVGQHQARKMLSQALEKMRRVIEG